MGFARMSEILVKFFKALPQGDLLQFGELVWLLYCRQAAFISAVFFFLLFGCFTGARFKKRKKKNSLEQCSFFPR